MNNSKLNDKGITLAELIVSFVIVAVAVIYFYQMLTSVTKMYANARNGINRSAKVNYAFRLLDVAYDLNEVDNTCKGVLYGIVTSCNIDTGGSFDMINFEIDGKEYILYKYPENNNDE